MSFILDALKKIEQDKRRVNDAPSESIAISGSRLGARQPVLAMVVIAVGSALLTVLAVSFLSGRDSVDEAAASKPVAAPPAPARMTALPVAEPDTREPEPEPSPRHAVRQTTARPPAEVVVAEPDVETNTPPEAKPRPEPARDVAVERDRAAADVAAVDDVDDAEPDASAAATAKDDTQPIRIVGRERVLLEGLNIEPAPDAVDGESDMEEPLPEGFPDLVLQGTSVIGTEAVAVISDQRVFEGDRIEGALVVRIGEREVELELDGRRFTLRL